MLQQNLESLSDNFDFVQSYTYEHLYNTAAFREKSSLRWTALECDGRLETIQFNVGGKGGKKADGIHPRRV